MSVSLVLERNEEISWQEVQIGPDSFQLNSGGSAYSPGLGHDTYSSIQFEAGIGWRDEDVNRNVPAVAGWLESFEELATDESYRVLIEDFGDEPLSNLEELPGDLDPGGELPKVHGEGDDDEGGCEDEDEGS